MKYKILLKFAEITFCLLNRTNNMLLHSIILHRVKRNIIEIRVVYFYIQFFFVKRFKFIIMNNKKNVFSLLKIICYVQKDFQKRKTNLLKGIIGFPIELCILNSN